MRLKTALIPLLMLVTGSLAGCTGVDSFENAVGSFISSSGDDEAAGIVDVDVPETTAHTPVEDPVTPPAPETSTEPVQHGGSLIAGCTLASENEAVKWSFRLGSGQRRQDISQTYKMREHVDLKLAGVLVSTEKLADPCKALSQVCVEPGHEIEPDGDYKTKVSIEYYDHMYSAKEEYGTSFTGIDYHVRGFMLDHNGLLHVTTDATLKISGDISSNEDPVAEHEIDCDYR